jgi:hypothetical protein
VTAAPGSTDDLRTLVFAAMEGLARTRPIFHSEADFQQAFAWECHRLRPHLGVRLERRLAADSNERLDVMLLDGGSKIAIELKYPVATLDVAIGDEPFLLRAQGAEDRMRFNYVWDIVRLERVVSAGTADLGAAVLLTNVPQLWRGSRPARRIPADLQFRLHEGRELAGRLGWSGEAVWWRREKLPEFVDLLGRYPLRWMDYSTLDGSGNGAFRWTAVFVQPSPSGAVVEPTTTSSDSDDRPRQGD